MQTDPLADFLTQIRNANKAGRQELLCPYSRIKSDVAQVLKKEGYIVDFEMVENGGHHALKLRLKADLRQKPIRGIRRVSRPGLRCYVGVKEIPRILGGLGTTVLSTSKGILSGMDAKKENVGGELLLTIW